MANAGAGRWFANPLAFLPVQFALGLIATLAAYALYRWFLAYPALSVSNGRTMLIYSAAAAVLFALLHDTGLALALAASFAGAAVALKILRQWPSRDRI